MYVTYSKLQDPCSGIGQSAVMTQFGAYNLCVQKSFPLDARPISARLLLNHDGIFHALAAGDISFFASFSGEAKIGCTWYSARRLCHLAS